MQRRQLPKPIVFTKDGFARKEKEYQELLTKRQPAVDDLKKAREMGDLSENGYYKAARFNLSSIDRRLREYRYLLRYATVTKAVNADTVQVGCQVTITNENGTATYELVGDYEADPKTKKISTYSPLGKALMHKKRGDTIYVNTPRNIVTYTITDIAVA